MLYSGLQLLNLNIDVIIIKKHDAKCGKICFQVDVELWAPFGPSTACRNFAYVLLINRALHLHKTCQHANT